MIRLAQSILALLFVISFATACTDNSDGKNAPGRPGQPGGNPKPDNSDTVTNPPVNNKPSVEAGDVATLPMTAWCVKFQNEEQEYFELRFKFEYDQTATSMFFKLGPDFKREGEAIQPQEGTWSIVGNQMTISFWKPPVFQVYVAKSDESATNEPELRLTQNGETHIFTSCE